MKSAFFAGIACWLAWSAPALADDSTAELAAGGLVLTQNADIRMVSEDLYISPTSVKVRYEFVNESSQDINAIVAFPLPDVDLSQMVGQAYGSMLDQDPNFVGFELTVDGKAVTPAAEERAFLNGKDITAEVRASGFPIDFQGPALSERLKHLSQADSKPLIAAGLLEDESADTYDWREVFPQWTTKTKFWWRQDFPAGKTVVIQHSYQPVTGDYILGDTDMSPSSDPTAYVNAYCVDPATAVALAAKAEPNANLSAYKTDFILTTANNWKGPIGTFRLTLDKLKAANVLSLCWPGALKKTGPTTFESTLTNFAPKRDIDMLVVY